MGIALPLLGRPAPARRVAMGFAWSAVVLHGFVTFSRLFASTGLDLQFFSSLSLVSFCIVGLCLIVNLFRSVAAVGVIVFPLAALLVSAALFATPIPSSVEWQIKLHVVIAVLGYSVLSIAALLALMLALQERALRRHHIIGLLRTLPPLTLTEDLMFQLIRTGFVLLSLTLLTGALFVENLFAQHLVHKTVLSIMAWITFGSVLWGRWRYGWRGRRAIHWTLIGATLLLLAFFGSKFVLEIILQRSS